MIIIAILACTGEKRTETEELEVINSQRIIQSDYEYVSEEVLYQGQQVYSYETNDTRFYTSREWMETIGEETTLRLQTATLNADGNWEQFTATVDGEPYYVIENYEFDAYMNSTYREVTGVIVEFEDEEDVTYAEYEDSYRSGTILVEKNNRFYREDGTPREIQHHSYFMHQFEPCPASPLFGAKTKEEFNTQGDLDHDQIYEFDDSGYPTRVYSTLGGWSYRYEFAFDEQGKPSSYIMINEENELLYQTYEFSYTSRKLSEYTITDYDDAGEMESMFRYEIEFTPSPLENPRVNGLCFRTKKDIDGNHQWEHWRLDSWNNVSRSYTRISTAGEEVGYYLQEFELFSFDVIE